MCDECDGFISTSVNQEKREKKKCKRGAGGDGWIDGAQRNGPERKKSDGFTGRQGEKRNEYGRNRMRGVEGETGWRRQKREG